MIQPLPLIPVLESCLPAITTSAAMVPLLQLERSRIRSILPLPCLHPLPETGEECMSNIIIMIQPILPISLIIVYSVMVVEITVNWKSVHRWCQSTIHLSERVVGVICIYLILMELLTIPIFPGEVVIIGILIIIVLKSIIEIYC